MFMIKRQIERILQGVSVPDCCSASSGPSGMRTFPLSRAWSTQTCDFVQGTCR